MPSPRKRIGFLPSEEVHEIIEKFLLGKLNLDLLGDNTREKMMADQIIENGLRNKLQEIWGCEATLYYPGKYAGSADCIGIYEGQPTILDFKQSNKPRKPQYNNNYYIQVSLYAAAHDKVFNTNITQGIILVCTSDYLFQSFKINNDFTRFYKNSSTRGVRTYSIPTVSWEMNRSEGFVKANIIGNARSYNNTHITTVSSTKLPNSQQSFIPQYQLIEGLNFIKTLNLRDNEYQQTLSPKIEI